MTTRGSLLLALGLVVVLAAGLLPFLQVLHHYPSGSDALVWTVQAHPETPGWAGWVFWHKHFVGYRPVTAVTFAINGVLTGWEPWGWVATDLLFHALAGLGVYGAWRALLPLRAPGWGVLAAGLFLAHPVSQAVVPYVARRSYSLSTALALLSVILFARQRSAWAAGALLLGILANEVGYVVLPVLVLLALARGGRDPRGLARELAPVVLVALVAMGLRFVVMGGFGGYWVPLAGDIEDGQRQLVAGGSRRSMLLTALAFAALPESPSGRPSFVLAWDSGGPWIGALLGLCALGWSLYRARLRDPVPLVLLAWTAGYALLAAVTRAWFPRLGYPMAAPLALWLACALVCGIEAARARRREALHLVPLAVLLAGLLQYATPIRGLDPLPIRGHFRATRLIRQAGKALGELEGPALVWVALPIRGANVGSTLYWIRREARPREVAVRLLATAVAGERTRPSDAIEFREREDATDGLVPALDMEWSADLVAQFRLRGPKVNVPIAALQLDERPTYVLEVEERKPVLHELKP